MAAPQGDIQTVLADSRIESQIRLMIGLVVTLGILGTGFLVWGLFQFGSTSDDLARLGSFLSGTTEPLWSAHRCGRPRDVHHGAGGIPVAESPRVDQQAEEACHDDN